MDVRVLVTGHRGYIGAVMVPHLQARGHDVIGLDTGLFEDCDFGSPPAAVPTLQLDIRDVTAASLPAVDAVVHLAAVSNDPLGQLDPDTTYAINHRATVSLAEAAKDAGIARFVFASSCSLYGAAGSEPVTEKAAFAPVTAYGHSKVLAEQGLSALADDSFSPTYLRNATAYGASPRLRCDIVVNNLVGWAVSTGQVRLQSDGSPWRPLVHVQDICAAVSASLDAPREDVHDAAFNVGRDEDNLQIRDIALLVEQVVAGSRVTFAEGATSDKRDYRVDFAKIGKELPQFQPSWTVARGVSELYEAYQRIGLSFEDLTGPRFVRLARVEQLLASQEITPSLRRQAAHD